MLCIDASPNFIVLLFMCLYEIFATKNCQYFPLIFANNICQYLPIFSRYFPLIFSTNIFHYFLDIFHYSIFLLLFYIYLLFLLILLLFYSARIFSFLFLARNFSFAHKKAATFSAATLCFFIQ